MSPWRRIRPQLLTLFALCACQGLGSGPTVPPALDPDLVQRGAFLFDDPALSGDGSRACATCHPAGGSNRKAYLAGEEVAFGSEGARMVPALRGAWQTAPYLWDGSLGSIDEVLDRMLAIEMRGGAVEGRDREALRAFVLSIPPFDRGRILPDGSPLEPATLSVRRGAAVYAKAECTTCHPPPQYTRPLRFDVGTGGKWSVPTLRGLSQWPPYGHDGRWATVEEAVRAILAQRKTELTHDEFYQLLAYLELL